MHLSACRIVKTNLQTFRFTCVEETLEWLEEHRDIERIEVDAIDNEEKFILTPLHH
ncbi:hypothetical protein [Vibrio taketomensis]|uniref:hypothetical protein n=1 Tax=Vibrio taketomensis TaxID=2572923 RepID=UPI00138A5117|nr:hypothetical protein [Vibrio taketomensis]